MGEWSRFQLGVEASKALMGEWWRSHQAGGRPKEPTGEW